MTTVNWPLTVQCGVLVDVLDRVGHLQDANSLLTSGKLAQGAAEALRGMLRAEMNAEADHDKKHRLNDAVVILSDFIGMLNQMRCFDEDVATFLRRYTPC